MNTGNPIQEETFPIVFFLDTNILEGLPESLESGELSSLISEGNETGTNVYLPDVVAREWCYHRVEKLVDGLKEFENGSKQIRKYDKSLPKYKIVPENLLKSVFTQSVRNIKASGLRVLGPPHLNLIELRNRAVFKLPPFKDVNKGFKDELVLLGVLKRLQEGWNYRTCVLVTQDRDFNEENLQNRFKPYGAVLRVVRTISEAKNFLKKKLTDTWTKEQEQIAREAKELASQYWNTISEMISVRIKEKGVSNWILTIFHKEGLEDSPTIKRIIRSKPIEIASVTVGVQRKDPEEIPLTIWVTTELDLEVQTYSSLSSDLLTGYVTMEGENPYEIKLRTGLRIVKRNIPIEAGAKRLEDGTWEGFHIIEAQV